MGFEIYSSILNSDYPMIVAVFTIIGFLTMIGYLVADILYAVVDLNFLQIKLWNKEIFHLKNTLGSSLRKQTCPDILIHFDCISFYSLICACNS